MILHDRIEEDGKLGIVMSASDCKTELSEGYGFRDGIMMNVENSYELFFVFSGSIGFKKNEAFLSSLFISSTLCPCRRIRWSYEHNVDRLDNHYPRDTEKIIAINLIRVRFDGSLYKCNLSAP